MNYPHTSIWINGRTINLQDIASGKAKPQTIFEADTFGFIADWLQEKSNFEIRTSGSTGKPKVISVRREQMISSAQMTAKALDLKSTFNALVCLETKFIAGRMMLVRCFVVGMKMYILEPCADPLVKIPEGERIDFTALVPYQIQATLESKHPHLLDKVRYVIVGGAPMSENLNGKLQNFASAVYATYGMTETISHIALRKINGTDASTHFHVLPGVNITKDERNCLVITASFLEEKIITNDIVEIVSDKQFTWIGRWDNIINSGGYKLSPEVIEARIGKIFTRLGIPNNFFVYGIPDERLGGRLALYIEGENFSDQQAQLLQNDLTHTFSGHENPKEIFVIASFMYTDTKKINRQLTVNSGIKISHHIR